MNESCSNRSETVSPKAVPRFLGEARDMRNPADLVLPDRSFCARFLPFTITKALLFDIPILSPGVSLPESGEPVTVRWLRQKDGYHYHFESSFLGRVQDTEDGLPAISIAYPNALTRTQRRQAFRVQVPLEDAQKMFLRWGASPNNLDCPAFAHDLSATGGGFPLLSRWPSPMFLMYPMW